MRYATAILCGILFLATAATAQQEGIAPGDIRPEKFYKAEVLSVTEQESYEIQGQISYSQLVKVRIFSGDEKGQELEIQDEGLTNSSQPQKLEIGETVVVGRLASIGEPIYYIADKYRLPALVWIGVIFFAAGIFFGRLRGLTSILGLCLSIAILALYIVPRILDGADPIATTLIGACVIVCLSLFLAHGFKKRTWIALMSTLATLFVAASLAWAFVHFGKLFGLGTEDAFYLQAFPGVNINLQGLLLGGIIIGSLGILDDVTTTQTATVDEIAKANSSLSVTDLYQRGLSVGREHIAALINTLALAYAGSALPLFLLFVLNKNQPLWVILNGELVAEEIVRSLVGSLALILAVPIATFLAAYFLKRKEA